jgi:hypothetical protein
MKTEINNENKIKFFTLYWGQFVGIDYERGIDARHVIESSMIKITDCVSLKPLSSISDEDARAVAEQNRFNGNYDVFPKVGRDILRRVFELKDSQMCLPMESADYLRSRGYALPWLDISINEMVEAGWIKLIKS